MQIIQTIIRRPFMILKNLTSLLSAVVLFAACSNHTSQIVTTRFDSNGNEISQKVTVLDKAGNKICETLYSLQDSILQQYLKTEYFFEVTGSRTDSIHINYSYVSGKWKADDKSICSFDSCGHRTELRTFRWNDGKWNECEPLYWVYDSIGRLTYSLSGMTREEHKYSLESDTTLFYYSSDYKEFLPTYMWVDSLDRNGNPLLTIRYRWIDDNWHIILFQRRYNILTVGAGSEIIAMNSSIPRKVCCYSIHPTATLHRTQIRLHGHSETVNL